MKQNLGPIERLTTASQGRVMPDNSCVVLEATFGLGNYKKSDVGRGATDRLAIAACARKHLKRIAEIAGGYTLTATEGGWIDGNGEYVEEPGFKVSVTMPSKTMASSGEDDIMLLLRNIAVQFNQAAVLVTRTEGQGACLSTSPAGGFRLI